MSAAPRVARASEAACGARPSTRGGPGHDWSGWRPAPSSWPRPGRLRQRGRRSAGPELVHQPRLRRAGRDRSRCTDAADGRYSIVVSTLPRDSPSQREQLVRRLAANDSSIDIMSLDPPYIPEFAQAGFFAPMPEDVADRVTQDVVSRRSTARPGTANWSPCRSGPTPSCSGTAVGGRGRRAGHVAAGDLGPAQPGRAGPAVRLGVQGIRSESLTSGSTPSSRAPAGRSSPRTPPTPSRSSWAWTRGRGARRRGHAADLGQRRGGRRCRRPTRTPPPPTSRATRPASGQLPFVWPRAQTAVEAGRWTSRCSTTTAGRSTPGRRRHRDRAALRRDQPRRRRLQRAPGPGLRGHRVHHLHGEPGLLLHQQRQPGLGLHRLRRTPTSWSPSRWPGHPRVLELAKPRPQTPYYSEVSGGMQREYHPTADIDPSRRRRTRPSSSRPSCGRSSCCDHHGDAAHRRYGAGPRGAGRCQRPGEGRAQAGLAAGRAGAGGDAAGHRLPDRPGVLRLVVRLPAHRPGEPVVHRAEQLPGDAHRPAVVAGGGRHRAHHRHHRRGRAGARVRPGAGDEQGAAVHPADPARRS